MTASVNETMRTMLSNCSLLDEFNGNIHVDYTNDNTNEGGLYPTGTNKIGEDIIGNERYSINYVLYVGLTAYEDYNRLANSDFLLKLTYYLNSIKDIEITETINDVERQGKITSISAGNGLLFQVPTGDINDGVQYQLQITVNYKITSE